MYGINIENGEKHKCPHCNSVYAVENDTEILYRNITLFYREKTTGACRLRCKQCKNEIYIK